VITGLHGNEPDPVEALRSFRSLSAEFGGLRRGRVAVFSGNRRALSVGSRYLDRDLNRGWTDGRLIRLEQELDPQGPLEDAEQRELYRAVEHFLEAASGPRVVFDLHSFSGEGRPFALGTDRGEHRRVARALGLSLVFGLQEALAGALSDFYDGRVEVCLAIETGRTGEPGIQERVREFMIRILEVFEMCAVGRFAPLPAAEPEVLRVTYRHPVGREDAFHMLPGFLNFQEVARGELLARDAQGPLYAPHTGWLLMPLYQEVGSDGFFLAQADESP
jgi:succinylglutamate desuccinylase